MEFRDITDIAKTIRKELKTQFPTKDGYKFSVTTERFSGGRALTIALTTAPCNAFVNVEGNEPSTYRQVNKFHSFDYETYEDYVASCTRPNIFGDTPNYMTQPVWEIMDKVTDIMDVENWDKSDVQSDYFNCNFYSNANIGKWDKPFVNSTR